MSDAFLEALSAYLKPFEGRFHYNAILHEHLNTDRFAGFVEAVNRYHPVAGSTVLSSGCGAGGDLEAFALAGGAARVYGIEVDQPLAELARIRLAAKGLADRGQVDIYDGRFLPYPDELFDIVISLHVIEHTRNPGQYLAELVRVLRPGGVVFLDVPNRYYPIEQHTQLRYYHYLPVKARNCFIRRAMAQPVAAWLSADTQYKLRASVDFQFCSPDQLRGVVRRIQCDHPLAWEDAFFHSNDQQRVDYRPGVRNYLWGAARRQTTFRLVLRKLAAQQGPSTGGTLASPRARRGPIEAIRHLARMVQAALS